MVRGQSMDPDGLQMTSRPVPLVLIPFVRRVRERQLAHGVITHALGHDARGRYSYTALISTDDHRHGRQVVVLRLPEQGSLSAWAEVIMGSV